MQAEQPTRDERPRFAQRYTDPTALARMAKGNCPECGSRPDEHSGWGGPICSLTDNGVATRIAQFEMDREAGHVG